jgi:trypsin
MLLVSIISSISFADVPPPIVNGNRTSDFVQVGAIMAYSEQQGGYPFCSGTLIHEKWVATAAHCVEAVDEYASYGMDIFFILGDNLYNDSGWDDYDVAVDWIIHPDYNGSQYDLGVDLGLMELETGFQDVEPVQLNQETPTYEWEGVLLDYVGWGVTRDNGQDSGIKRHTQIPFVGTGSLVGYDDDFIISYDEDTNLCSGDSGGAALQSTEDGYVLVGVNSFVFSIQGSQPCVGGASGATRIDLYYDWIREFVPEPTPPEPEISEETEDEFTDGDNLDGEGDEKLIAGCSTIDGATPGFLLFSLLAIGIRKERNLE